MLAYLAIAVSAVLASVYIIVTHHYLLIFAFISERAGSAFSFITVPIATVAGLLRFTPKTTALMVIATLLSALVALVIVMSSGRGFAVSYLLMSGDFKNAFWQYPPIMLNILLAALLAAAAWRIALYFVDYTRPTV